MTLIAFCADKGSPGVTTSALAVAAAWPRPVVLAELDPSGGDLALRLVDRDGRYVLAARPGLLTWAAAARLAPVAAPVRKHCQTVYSGLPVLAGVAGAEQALGLGPLWPDIATGLATTSDDDVIADLGRLLPESPLWSVVAAADVVVVVAAGTVEGLVHARDRLRALVADRRPVGAPSHPVGAVTLLLVARDRQGPQAMDAARTVVARERLPVTVIGFLAIDRAGVAELQCAKPGGRPARTLLARSARQVAVQLCGMLPPPPPVASAAGPARDATGRHAGWLTVVAG
jgi:MinD-like ATPase involved in chromosome partitioning or flagellar assembly